MATSVRAKHVECCVFTLRWAQRERPLYLMSLDLFLPNQLLKLKAAGE
jgi:hypothetical protein